MKGNKVQKLNEKALASSARSVQIYYKHKSEMIKLKY